MNTVSNITLAQVQKTQAYINSRLEHLEKSIESQEISILKTHQIFKAFREKPHLADTYLIDINKYAKNIKLLNILKRFKTDIETNAPKTDLVDYFGYRLNRLISELKEYEATTDILELFNAILLK